ncbi:MAG: hypothetical protein COA73_05150 [Candidatus Hydrogenedentota bacterium]|nr:MAG: hypothetical protein COA73_05150 [Candidatus Hydrogenedentota bacterium]
MDKTPDDFWKDVVPSLSKEYKLHPLSMEEAQAAFDAAEDEGLSDAELDSIIAFAKTGKEKVKKSKKRRIRKWIENLDVSITQQNLTPVLNRNANEEDETVKSLMDELREKAIKDYLDENETRVSDDEKEGEGSN